MKIVIAKQSMFSDLYYYDQTLQSQLAERLGFDLVYLGFAEAGNLSKSVRDNFLLNVAQQAKELSGRGENGEDH